LKIILEIEENNLNEILFVLNKMVSRLEDQGIDAFKNRRLMDSKGNQIGFSDVDNGDSK